MEKMYAIAALAALAQETRLDIFRLLVQAGADGTVVSSSLKGTGTAFGHFDPGRVTSFMTAARAARRTS